MAEGKGCHGNDNGNGATATNPKMMPRQHIGSDNSVEILVKKEACECAEQAKDGGMIPTTGFPRISGMETSDNSDTVQAVHIIQHMHSFTGVVLSSYTFEACVFKA